MKDGTAFQRDNQQTILEKRGNRFLWVPRELKIIKSSTKVFPGLRSERGPLTLQMAEESIRGLGRLWAFTGVAEPLKGGPCFAHLPPPGQGSPTFCGGRLKGNGYRESGAHKTTVTDNSSLRGP